MASDELDATTDIVTLAEHADGLGESTAERLDDNGIETVADVLIAEEDTLTDIPYVSEVRAERLRELVDEIADGFAPDPLVNSREAGLDVGLGEKVEIVTEDGESWASSWCVVDVDEPVSWTAPLGEDFETRTVTVRTSPQSGRQYDLLVTGDEVWMAGEYKGQPYQRLWRVEQVNPVGRVSQSSYAQLIGQQQDQEDARPEGDDTWRQYQSRGEA